MKPEIAQNSSSSSLGSARRVDMGEVAGRTFQFATPTTLVVMLLMGKGFVSEQIESDTQVRIHVEKLDGRLQSLEKSEEETKRVTTEGRKNQQKTMIELQEEVRSLRECVIAPRTCR